MKIKIHSSLKNIRLMVSIGIPIGEAIALAASTIVKYGSKGVISQSDSPVYYDTRWLLDPEHYTIIKQ